MKKNITILAICALISVGSFQAPSHAMEKENSIPIDILESEKMKCQTILPTLTKNLELWNTHRLQNFKLKTLPFEAPYFSEFKKCLESTKIMDELNPQIREQSCELLDILAALQEQYPQGEDVLGLMGLVDEWNAIGNNMAFYISHYNPESNSQLSTAS